MTDIHSWGGGIALAGTAAAVLALIVVHVLPTGIRPFRDPRHGVASRTSSPSPASER